MIPTIVIGGYLGAGKTTLVNHLLRGANGRRITVLVNDFGSVNIDADLIEAHNGDVLSLSGGCLCCSFGVDLVGTLKTVVGRHPAPDLVLIETSGVALPATAASTARLAPGVAIEGIVVLVDASRLNALAADRYVGELVRQQWRHADLLLLNQADRVSPAALATLRQRLRLEAPRAPVIDCVQAAVVPALVFGINAIEHDDAHPAWAQARAIGAAAKHFMSCTVALPRGVDVQALRHWLCDPGLHLLRAKGSCIDGQGQSWWLHQMGSRCELTAVPTASATGQLVVFGHCKTFDTVRFRAGLTQFMATIQP